MRPDWVLCPACGFDLRTGVLRDRLTEAPPTTYEDYWVAWWAARDIRKRLPRVRSAYSPSGRLPRKALMPMMAGSALGAVAGAAAGLGIGFAFGLLVLGLALVLGPLFGARALANLLGIVMAIGSFLVYAAMGGVAARIVAGTGRRVGSRSVRAALLFSFASAIAGAVLLFALSVAILAEAGLPAPKGLSAGVFFMTTVSLATAWVVAARTTRAAKFCELCLQRMESQELPYLSLGGAIALVRAIATQGIAGAPSILRDGQGSNAKVTLFSCPTCRCGYLELTYEFLGQYQASGSDQMQSLKRSWLAGSWPLTPAQVDMLSQPVDGTPCPTPG